MSTFTCPDHGYRITPQNVEGCPWCRIDLLTGPLPEHMDREGRAREILRLSGAPLTVRWLYLWKRLDALVGRPTFNHEWAEPARLAEELRSGGEPEHPLDSLRRLAGDRPVLVVEL